MKISKNHVARVTAKIQKDRRSKRGYKGIIWIYYTR